MKTYDISLPGYKTTIRAKNQAEALEQFWFDYDCAQEDSGWGQPIIKLADKKHGRTND